MESSDAQAVFISTEELAKLIDSKDKNLKLFDATSFMTAEEGDPILTFRQNHITG